MAERATLRRRWRAAATTGLATLVALVTLAPSAGAQTSGGGNGLDANRCATFSNGGSGLGGGGVAGGGAGGGGGGSWGGSTSTTVSSSLQRDDEDEHGLCSTLMERIIPGDNPGQFPTSHYDLGYDQGGTFSLWRKASGWLMDQTFAGARWFVRIGLWATNWSLEFRFADKLAAPAQRVADTYRTQVVERLGLEHFFLVLAALYGFWLAARGRITRGSSEFGLSILIVALAATVLSDPGRYLLDSLKFTADLSYEVAALTSQADPNAAPPSSQSSSVAQPMLAAIHKAFVETPHEILNWGRQVPPGDPCRATYEAAVASGPWGPADEPRDAMKAAGCVTEANFNHDPSGDRVLGAFLILLAAMVVMLLLMLVAGTLVAAQLGIVIAVAVSPIAFVSGALPGTARVLFWRWVGSVLQALAGVVMMAVLLSLFLVGTSALLLATASDALAVQMGSIVVVVLIAIVKRRRLLERGQRAVSHFTQRVTHARAGGGGGRGWVGPAAAGAAIGFGADEIFDHLRHGHHQVRGAVDSHRRRRYQRIMVDNARHRRHGYEHRPAYGDGGDEGDEGTSAAERLAHRMRSTRTGRVVAAAGGGAAFAAKATVGGPVYWPRWKRQASEAASVRAAEIREHLVDARRRARDFGHEWVAGAKAPVRGAHRAWRGASGVANEAVMGARLAANGVPLWASGGCSPGGRDRAAEAPTSRTAGGGGARPSAPPADPGEPPTGPSGRGPTGSEPPRRPPSGAGGGARRPMARADGAVPRVGDVISYREAGPSGPVTRQGKVVGVERDPATDGAVPVVKAGARGQTRPAAEWDRIVRTAPAAGAGDGSRSGTDGRGSGTYAPPPAGERQRTRVRTVVNPDGSKTQTVFKEDGSVGWTFTTPAGSQWGVDGDEV